MSSITVATPEIISVAIFFAILLYVKIKIKKKQNINKKFIIFLTIIVIIVETLSSLNLSKEFKMYFVDVGQGDCTLIITPENKKILIDGGGSPKRNVGKNTLIPYLLDRKVSKLDYVIISHFDFDHVRTGY